MNTMSGQLAYLGILAAKTSRGRRAVAVALSGSVELYHIVYAGFMSDSQTVNDWLWTAGINPEEAANALPPEIMVRDILLPAIGSRPLVVCHSDMDVPLVDMLCTQLGRAGNPPIVSGIDLTGPIQEVTNGAAGRRAFALQARYEAELEEARRNPAVHVLDGTVDDAGILTGISVSGPFSKQAWTLESPDDAIFVMAGLAGMGDMVQFAVKEGPAAGALARVAEEVGIERRKAA